MSSKTSGLDPTPARTDDNVAIQRGGVNYRATAQSIADLAPGTVAAAAAAVSAASAQAAAATASTQAGIATTAAGAAAAAVATVPPVGRASEDLSHRFRPAALYIDTNFGSAANRGNRPLESKASVAGLFQKAALGGLTWTATGGGSYYSDINTNTLFGVPPYAAKLAVFYLLSSPAVPIAITRCFSVADLEAEADGYFVASPNAQRTRLYVKRSSNTAPDSSYFVAISTDQTEGVGIRAGSVITDATLEPALGFSFVGTVGIGDPAFFNCGKAIAAGDWILSDHADATANVREYTTPLVREPNVVYHNDPEWWALATYNDGTEEPLKTVNTVAQVAATPGSVCFVSPTDETTTARISATAKIFYHPKGSGSVAPKVEVPIRKGGVSYFNFAAANTFNAFGGKSEIRDVRARLCMDGQGHVVGQQGTTISNALLEWGPKHHVVVEPDSYLKDVIGYGQCLEITTGYIGFTWYRGDDNGGDAAGTRCMYIMPDNYPGGTGFYGHGSGGGPFGDFRLDQPVLYNGGDFATNGTPHSITLNDMLCSTKSLSTVQSTLSALGAAGLTEGQWGAVAQYDGGNTGIWIVRASQLVQLTTTHSVIGDIQIGANADAAGQQAILRRPIFTGLAASLIIPSAGATAQPTGLLRIENGVFNKDASKYTPAISPAVARPIEIENNVCVQRINGYFSWYYSDLDGIKLKYRYNIILFTGTSNGQLQDLLAFRTASDNSHVIDYNIYCLIGDGLATLTVDGTQRRIETPDRFATYQAAVAAKAVDQHSIALYGTDYLGLFEQDPLTTGNYRLNPATALTFGGGSSVLLAGPQEHLDWNDRRVYPGAPRRLPKAPRNHAECLAYNQAPAEFDWYRA